MSAKRPFPRGQANFRARPRGEARPRVPSLARRVRITMTVLAVALIGLGAGALPSLAAPGRVYFDDDDNVAAGENLFNESFTGAFNVGLGRRVMPKLTSGGANVAVGHSALHDNTRGNDNIATGLRARQ
jgi:trimeric autotransporter adhesin